MNQDYDRLATLPRRARPTRDIYESLCCATSFSGSFSVVENWSPRPCGPTHALALCNRAKSVSPRTSWRSTPREALPSKTRLLQSPPRQLIGHAGWKDCVGMLMFTLLRSSRKRLCTESARADPVNCRNANGRPYADGRIGVLLRPSTRRSTPIAFVLRGSGDDQ